LKIVISDPKPKTNFLKNKKAQLTAFLFVNSELQLGKYEKIIMNIL